MSVSPSLQNPPAVPMAGGQPISEIVADQAAEWLTLLMSGRMKHAEQQRWQHWRNAHPDHERAWLHIEAVTQRFKTMDPAAGYKALSPYAGPKSSARRKLLSVLLWGTVTGTSGILASRTQTWQQQTADYRTGTGEQRIVELEDGTRITLNTASAINIRFDGERRLLRLVAGEVMVATAHARYGIIDNRPLMMESAQGIVRALGTRFSVRQETGRTFVAVQESAVEISPAGSPDVQIVQAGESSSFTRTEIDMPRIKSKGDDAWAHGQIIAEDMPLGEFLADLGRYRTGLVRCDPVVAALRLSGVFPVADTTRVLAALPSVLPVRVTLRTRFWVTVEPAG